ncbi:MAG: thiamine-phosphate kinase [Polyangiaceae bacterium]
MTRSRRGEDTPTLRDPPDPAQQPTPPLSNRHDLPPAASRSSEHTRIRMLRSIFGDADPNVELTLGDDCAILRPTSERIVWSIDSAVEGMHFRRDIMTLEDAGYRATMAALSDLAAMGARPIGVVAGLVLPIDLNDDDFLAIARGQRDAASIANTLIVGGNLSRGETLSITTSVLGTVDRPVRRSGASPGDDVLLAGRLGLAAVGLRLAMTGRIEDADTREALVAFRRPHARIEAGRSAMRAGATAMIDVSDGLAADAAHVATESKVTIVLDQTQVLGATSARLSALARRDPLDLALSGGEDYALLATAPRGSSIPGFTRIGTCEERSAHLVLIENRGARRPAPIAGFDHFT